MAKTVSEVLVKHVKDPQAKDRAKNQKWRGDTRDIKKRGETNSTQTLDTRWRSM